MNLFSVLLILNLGLLAICLVKARPTALVIVLNQIATLRALESIGLYGQPASAQFLPSEVFSSRNLDIAAIIFAISTALLGWSLVQRSRATPGPPPKFPPLSRWVLVLLFLFVVAITVSSGSLLTQTYANESGTIGGKTLGGANALLFSLVLYEIARRVFIGRLRPATGFLVLAVIMFLTCYSKGSTGLATGYGVVGATMLWPRGRLRLGRQAMISLAMIGAVALTAYIVRGVRQDFFERGWSTVTRLLESTGASEGQRANTGQGFEEGTNGTQYACHVLECVQLYEAGIERGWRSLYNPLIFTFEPSFLLEPLEISRPEDAPWELADHFIQGGGIYVLGELYWNGGWFCLFVVFGALVVLSFYCDTRYRTHPLWLMMCVQFAPNAFMGLGYGVAQTSRGAINGLLVIGAHRLLATRLRFKAGQPRFLIGRATGQQMLTPLNETPALRAQFEQGTPPWDDTLHGRTEP